MTALAEHILDTALQLANASPYGRLCPPMLACLDELPSTAPLPTLRTRMANERALGISFIYAAQTWRQLAAIFGEDEARALFGLTNVLVMFGGSKDVDFNREVSDLVGTTRVARTNWQLGVQPAAAPPTAKTCHPAPRRGPATPRKARPGDRRELQTDHRRTHPLHRRQSRHNACSSSNAELRAQLHSTAPSTISAEARASPPCATERTDDLP